MVLELLKDVDMHLFTEEGTRGGILVVSKLFLKANNLDFLCGSEVSGRAAQSPQWISTCPRKKKRIENGWMSDYQKSMVHELGLRQNKKRTCFDTTGQKKIMYRIHGINLQFYL